MDKPVIYLAGSMTGLTWKEALEWREQATWQLEDKWKLINPVRQQLGSDENAMIEASTQKDGNLILAHTATGICAQDEFYIDQCDWLFCNLLGAPRVSIGTMWELGYAWGQDKKILTVVEPGSIHDHPFVRRRSHIFTPDFDEAVEFFATIAI